MKKRGRRGNCKSEVLGAAGICFPDTHENANLKMKTKNTCTDFKNSKLGQGEDDVGRGKGELGMR